mmetsp:Transcript_119490/g.334683  ORF Transcript_119490/g.334683 Transcript_119490/m.334683 type:complete len:255 (-) Transcript_119490:125-889(-)
MSCSCTCGACTLAAREPRATWSASIGLAGRWCAARCGWLTPAFIGPTSSCGRSTRIGCRASASGCAAGSPMHGAASSFATPTSRSSTTSGASRGTSTSRSRLTSCRNALRALPRRSAVRGWSRRTAACGGTPRRCRGIPRGCASSAWRRARRRASSPGCGCLPRARIFRCAAIATASWRSSACAARSRPARKWCRTSSAKSAFPAIHGLAFGASRRAAWRTTSCCRVTARCAAHARRAPSAEVTLRSARSARSR